MNLNGPVNYVRMKNKDKEIYIFSDIHNNPSRQTKCDMSTLNHDFDNYLKVFLDKTKETIDFFLEIEDIKNKNYSSDQMYILNIRKLFQSLKYGESKYSNVRFHFTDIRDASNFFQNYNISNLRDNLYNYGNITSFLDGINNDMIFFKELLIITTFILKQPNYPTSELKEIKITELNEYLMKILNKILNEKTYNSKHVCDIIRKYFREKIFFLLSVICGNIFKIYDASCKIEKEYFDEKKTNYNKILEYKIEHNISFKSINVSNYPKKYINNTKDTIIELEEIINLIDDLHFKIMDLYFLRRFLDKDYIKKGIMYCGNRHFVHYISFLVKYFDFEILECDKFYIVSNIKELEKKLKTEDFEYCYDYFTPDNYNQCIHLKKDLFT
jgi:hypothetical protein